ncbi:MAG: ATP-dependent RNA helicase HrpA [Actinomycetota bacterium]|nr:ATP-dependent RNA helicase HrpA [Actinomycetota bacterium]
MTTNRAALHNLLQDLPVRERIRLERRLARALQPGATSRAGELERIAQLAERARHRLAERQASVPRLTYPDELPISAHREEIAAAIEASQVVVVAGETGSGKTTQLPKICLEVGRGTSGMIGHTQPRRIAARTVAERLADELGVSLGAQVGYAVRFTDVVGSDTLVKVMTDGILLAEIRRDRLLSAYDTIIVDEAHERSLNIDFLLGYLTQLLPRRRDLKVIVTSATIDTARFAAHFDAPVIEVSGRSYPVEVRYQPPEEMDDDRDPNQALGDAVTELLNEGPGDILVFLPGERDIKDATEALRERELPDLELLPLYARLSAAEQHRVFQPHRTRRVVLATNVAETSLTVPGIHYVIDTGLARISRYSHRTKVQRLPIEPISKASANQRAGRCGRIAPGICIRLYSEEDYAARPEFTDPEILRTNLASVILQMAAIGLGDIERFPFLEPPDRRAVADGRALLDELGAFDRKDSSRRLSTIGRQLAELPLDPRLARMVVEAEIRGCLREVTIIAAALSIQDPRERPLEKAQAADELHRRFNVAGSDFLAFVHLWDYLAELRAERSGNQFRRQCRAEYLNVLRIREWQDIAGQIRHAYRSRGVHANTDPADPAQVHQAVLAGLLSQIGMRDRNRGDYLGARNTRWQIARASSLAKAKPGWAMAGALVETEKTWARTVARIEPAWAERLGGHLTKRSLSEPWWDANRGEAVASERITLYGLPVVAARTTSLARTDPGAARKLFIQHALIEEDWHSPLPILQQIRTRREAAAGLVDRVRRHGTLVSEDALMEFFEAVLPAPVTTGKRLERWWRQASESERQRLMLPITAFIGESRFEFDPAAYPDTWCEEEVELPLRYRFAPGEEDDGVTVEVPIEVLNRLSRAPFDWHIPAYRNEVVEALLRSLPKGVRRVLVPIAETAAELARELGPETGGLRESLAARVSKLTGQPLAESDFDLSTLSPHLRLRFAVHDEAGTVLGASRDLDALRHQLGPALRRAVANAVPELSGSAATTWAFGDLPHEVRRGPLRAYPTLVDEGTRVAVAVVDSPGEQAEQMWKATRRLLALATPVSGAHVQRRLTNAARLALARSSISLDALIEDCTVAALDAIIETGDGPSFEAAGFAALADVARRTLGDTVARTATQAGSIVAQASELRSRVADLEIAHARGVLHEPILDIRRQLDGLVYAGFVADAGIERLGDIARYLAAIAQRLDQLPADARRDRERQARVAAVERRFDEVHDQLAARGTSILELAAVRWMLEEFRVSLWAQRLGTRGAVSESRILRALADLSG